MGFLEDIAPRQTDLLFALRERAREGKIPVVRPETAALLKILIMLRRPARVLEVGTAIGYSAILMASFLPVAPHIDTVELDPERVLEARSHIRDAGLESAVRVIAGDAAEVLPCLQTPYDLIFLDGPKGHYLEYYDELLRLLAPNGVLFCDNVIFYGKIFDKPEEAPHKHRTIVANMRAFLERLSSDDRLNTAILRLEDGVAVSVRKGVRDT